MSFLSDHLPVGPFVLDASAIINLLGSEDMAGVLRALGAPGMVEERTMDEIKRHPIDGSDPKPFLALLAKERLLSVERMSDEEYETYLSLVSRPLSHRLGSGESAAIALTRRSHPVILDESKARRILAREYPNAHCTSSLGLFITAGYRGGWSVGQVQKLVLAAQRHSRMGVPRENRDALDDLMSKDSNAPVVST